MDPAWFALPAVAGLLVLGMTAPAPAADDPGKLPDLKSKEWKPQGDKGLKVWDVKEGKGEAVKAGATVTIHYTGWTTDGKVFDSSRPRNDTATFPLGSLIKGWQEGIPGMKPGGVRRLLIPASLGYGAEGSPPEIPGNATLVFEIELFEDPFKLPDLKSKEWKKLADTGIDIWDVTVGTGAEVQPGDTVTIHYTGWTKDGKVFDSSRKRGEPATFPLRNLIVGWQEAVPGMKIGGVRRMVIPYAKAYGEKGRPPVIPAKADLVFEIEVKARQ
ncbi:MAG: FKBP-type peptidyl-prolyl cis-trans isomerase [Gemmataceae bacterium]